MMIYMREIQMKPKKEIEKASRLSSPKKEDEFPDYGEWLASIKRDIAAAQQRAALAVNHELVRLYWQIGHDILVRQKEQGWGAKVIARLADDLRAAFPEMKGGSRANLLYMRAFAEAWTQDEIVQAPLGQLTWYHLITLQTKLKDKTERLAYATATTVHGWSRNVLVHHIEAHTLERTGQSQNNFEQLLPPAQSDLTRESLKDPYKLDFLGIGKDAMERELENALVARMTDFLLELGSGFAFVGKQVHLEVGGEDFYIDLLFYHLKLHCYFVIELKGTDFKPEHLGQLGFYVTAVDQQIRTPQDTPTIGLLLCKSKNKIVAEYTLKDMHKPLGVSSYELTRAIPNELKTSLPTIEEIEKGLSESSTGEKPKKSPK